MVRGPLTSWMYSKYSVAFRISYEWCSVAATRVLSRGSSNTIRSRFDITTARSLRDIASRITQKALSPTSVVAVPQFISLPSAYCHHLGYDAPCFRKNVRSFTVPRPRDGLSLIPVRLRAPHDLAADWPPSRHQDELGDWSGQLMLRLIFLTTAV